VKITGFDGNGSDNRGAGAIVLEDKEVCALLFGSIEKRALSMPALQHNLGQVMSMAIARDQSVMLMLASMHAKERPAVLPLNLVDR